MTANQGQHSLKLNHQVCVMHLLLLWMQPTYRLHECVTHLGKNVINCNDHSDCDSINIYVLYMSTASDAERLLTDLFEKERPQPVRILQTLLQLAKEVAAKLHRGVTEGSHLESVWGKSSGLCVCARASLTPYAIRRFGECCRTRFCPFPSCHRGRLPPSFDPCSP